MKAFFQLILPMFLLLGSLQAQDNIYPADKYQGLLFIRNGTVHVGNGQVLDNTDIEIRDGKIVRIGASIPVPADDVKVFDAKGSHVYPGLILPASSLGLVEVPTVRATNDAREIGSLNPSIRSVVAYNTDSKIINTVRSNGILLANIVPDGGQISGSSSVMMLDGWNWEDAAYKTDGALHYRMPDLFRRPNRFAAFFGIPDSEEDPVKRNLELIEEHKAFFREARAYAAEKTHSQTNLKLEAVKNLFTRQQKLFVHCDVVRELLVAIDFVKEFGFDVVIVGGSESWQVADLLKKHNIPVILAQMHNLPTLDDDDIDQPFKTPAILQKAGVLFCINDDDSQNRGRNLPFNAGTAVAYGLKPEEALAAITLNTARILGIAERTGSLEVGKDANIIISQGDLLDMRTSIVTHAWIQGRKLPLDDKHKQLYERYKHKYGMK